jgi:hypothetical protein
MLLVSKKPLTTEAQRTQRKNQKAEKDIAESGKPKTEGKIR